MWFREILLAGGQVREGAIANALAGIVAESSRRVLGRPTLGVEYYRSGGFVRLFAFSDDQKVMRTIEAAMRMAAGASLERVSPPKLSADEGFRHAIALKIQGVGEAQRRDRRRGLSLADSIVSALRDMEAGDVQIVVRPTRKTRKLGRGQEERLCEVEIRIAAQTQEDARTLATIVLGAVNGARGKISRIDVRDMDSRLTLRGSRSSLLPVRTVAELLVPPETETSAMKLSFSPPMATPAALMKKVFGEGIPLLKANGFGVVRFKPSYLRRHMLIVGSTGSGKTTFLANMLASAMFHEGGIAFVVLPKATDAEAFLGALRGAFGESYLRRNVVVIDFLHTFFPLNVLYIPPSAFNDPELLELAKNRAKFGLFYFFSLIRGESSAKAPNVRLILGAITDYLLHDITPGTEISLRDVKDVLQRLLQFKKTKKSVEEILEDIPPDLVDVFNVLTNNVRGETIMAVYNRLYEILSSPSLAALLCSSRQVFPLEKMVEGESRPMIFIFDLSRLPTPQLIAGVMAAILARVWTLAQHRKNKEWPIWLIIDEFHELTNVQLLDTIIPEARAQGLSLVFSLQFLTQIQRQRLRDELLNNTHIKLFFTSEEKPDVPALKVDDKDFAEFVPRLPRFHVIVSVRGLSEEPLPPFLAKTYAPPGEALTRDEYDELLAYYRTEYGLSREDLEETTVEERESERDAIIRLIAAACRPPRGGDLTKISQAIAEAGLRVDDFSLIDYIEKLRRAGLLDVRWSKGEPSFVLTADGLELLKSSGPLKRAGGIVHRELLILAEEYLRTIGYDVTVVQQDSGDIRDQPDGIAKKGKDVVAIEVETLRTVHPDQIRHNYRKNVKKGLRVLFVVPGERERKKIEEILGPDADGAEIITRKMMEDVIANLREAERVAAVRSRER